MPSLDERREVAAMLREPADGQTPMFCKVAKCVGLNCDDYRNCNECYGKMLVAIADLIEPEPERTCRNEFDRCFAFECSECGVNVEGGDMLGHNSSEGAFNFCPNCGAKVVGE